MAHRVAVSVVAGALILAAELAATLSAVSVHSSPAKRPPAKAASGIRFADPGEPQLHAASSAPSAPRLAAVRFVRDYALWRSGRSRTMPARDMTTRVLRSLELEGRGGGIDAAAAAASVRIAPAPGGRYVVTSLVGNFLVGWQSRWVVVSVPGD